MWCDLWYQWQVSLRYKGHNGPVTKWWLDKTKQSRQQWNGNHEEENKETRKKIDVVVENVNSLRVENWNQVVRDGDGWQSVVKMLEEQNDMHSETIARFSLLCICDGYLTVPDFDFITPNFSKNFIDWWCVD